MAIRNLSGDFPIAVHPGDVLQEMLDKNGISPMDLAKHLNVDVTRIYEICRRKRGVSIKTAVMLGKALGTSAGLWMNLQNNWELSKLNPRFARHVRPIQAIA